jgi:hypothetical protein
VQSRSLRLTTNPVNGTRSPLPVENLMEDCTSSLSFVMELAANSIATQSWEFEEVGDEQPPESTFRPAVYIS